MLKKVQSLIPMTKNIVDKGLKSKNVKDSSENTEGKEINRKERWRGSKSNYVFTPSERWKQKAFQSLH